MKQTVYLFAAILLLAAVAAAQTNPDNTSLPLAASSSDTGITPAAPSLFAVAATPAPVSANGMSAASANDPGSSSTVQQPASVYNVYQNYNWQVSGGYTFFRFCRGPM